jgi:hypothetical protein
MAHGFHDEVSRANHSESLAGLPCVIVVLVDIQSQADLLWLGDRQ